MYKNLIKLCRNHGIAYPVETLLQDSSYTCYNYGILGAKMRHNLKTQWLANVTEGHSKVYMVESAAMHRHDNSKRRDGFNALQAKGMLAHFLHVLRQRRSVLPFGLAQICRSPVATDSKEKGAQENHFIYSSLDQTEMSLLFFAEPTKSSYWINFWRTARLQWWNKFARKAASFNATSSDSSNRNGVDIQYNFPWGETLVESIHDHGQDPLGELEDEVGISLQGLVGDKFTLPNLIELHTTVERGLSAFLFDACVGDLEDDSADVVLHLHPKLAPFHVALVTCGGDEVPELKEISRHLAYQMHLQGILILDVYDVDGVVDPDIRRYDNIGVIWTVIVTDEALQFGTVLLRNRNTGIKEIVSLAGLCERLSKYISSS